MTKNAKGRQRHTRKSEAPKDLVKKEYTEEEKARIAKYLERCKRNPLRVTEFDQEANALTINVLEGDWELTATRMLESFGTPDNELQMFLLNQVVQTFKGCVSSEGFGYDRLDEFTNNAMALLNGIQPQDEIEGMLAVQMIAVHNMVMETMKRAMITDQTFEGTEAYVNHATKMLRTFTTQMEALKRYRTGGQQKVTVEHVHVNEGGQAIVGVVNRGEGSSGKRE